VDDLGSVVEGLRGERERRGRMVAYASEEAKDRVPSVCSHNAGGEEETVHVMAPWGRGRGAGARWAAAWGRSIRYQHMDGDD
jgi:hypothetical protein